MFVQREDFTLILLRILRDYEIRDTNTVDTIHQTSILVIDYLIPIYI